MNEFKIGEVAMISPTCKNPRECLRPYLGKEVTVIGPSHVDIRVLGGISYPVQAQDGVCFCAAPEALIKRYPPRGDHELVLWSQCPWQPEKVRV